MPPKEEPKNPKKDPVSPAVQGGSVKSNAQPIASAVSTASISVSDSNLAPQVEFSPSIDTAVTAFLGEILKEFRELKEHYSHLDSKIEAVTLERMHSPLQNSFSEQSPMHPSFREPNHRQSLGSFHSSNTVSSQEVVVKKNSFRLDKPKYDAPKDTSIDGALDDSVLKFFDECDRYVEAWKAMAENKDKPFEGEHNFALLSLPGSVQKAVAHSFDLIFSTAEVVMWSAEEIETAQYWKRARTKEIRQSIVDRKAQGIANHEALKSIQSPAIAFAKGVGLIHLDAFNQYKDQLVTQIARLAEGGVVLSLVVVKDAIISAIPDAKFKAELYSLYGHAGTLPGPTIAGDLRSFTIKQIFEYIRQHIVSIKKKGLAELVNKNSVSFSFPTPPTSRKFGNHGPPSRFPSRAVQAIELDHGFPESDRTFWSTAHAEAEVSADDSDEFHQVNAMIQQVKSKECHHKGIGPDGKVLCPYLGNPDTAKCGFIHPAKELELRGKGVSKSTPAQPKKVHHVSSGLEIPYAADFDEETDVERSDF
jgi:hypothetical protein